jgi:hypothetical protein
MRWPKRLTGNSQEHMGLACDLHSIKLLADLDHFAKMRVAMDNAFGHAQALHMDEQVLSGIRKLKSTFYSKEPLTTGDKTEIREQVDAMIDYFGRLAIQEST